MSLRQALKNGFPLCEDKPSENSSGFHLLCALRDSVAVSTGGFGFMPVVGSEK